MRSECILRELLANAKHVADTNVEDVLIGGSLGKGSNFPSWSLSVAPELGVVCVSFFVSFCSASLKCTHLFLIIIKYV